MKLSKVLVGRVVIGQHSQGLVVPLHSHTVVPSLVQQRVGKKPLSDTKHLSHQSTQQMIDWVTTEKAFDASSQSNR